MRYGILEYKNKNCINIGDAMQLLAIEQLYESMGIGKSELIAVNYYDLQDYDGEEVLLPVAFPFYGYNKNNRITCFSPKIRPVFLALSLYDTNLEQDEIAYLKQYGPIGCRDRYTAEGLREMGIDAYLNGCLTLTISADGEGGGRRIYGIEIPDEIKNRIKAQCGESIVERTHIYGTIAGDTVAFAKEQLKLYKRDARLVVTSRLHAAVPCYAAGIPVVFVNQEYSHRFSWMEDILHVSLPDEWDAVDWAPETIFQNEKALKIREKMTRIAQLRLLQKDASQEIAALQQLYAGAKQRPFCRSPIDSAVAYIESRWKKEDAFSYAVWGISQVASAIISYLDKNYPNAVLRAVIDAAKTEKFKGVRPMPMEKITWHDDTFVFVTADAVNPVAIRYFKQRQMTQEHYLLCWKHLQTEEGKLPVA